jgi:hypothetical protein
MVDLVHIFEFCVVVIGWGVSGWIDGETSTSMVDTAAGEIDANNQQPRFQRKGFSFHFRCIFDFYFTNQHQGWLVVLDQHSWTFCWTFQWIWRALFGHNWRM